MGEEWAREQNTKQNLSKRAQKKLELSRFGSFLAEMESPNDRDGADRERMVGNQEFHGNSATGTSLCKANKTWVLGKALGLVFEGDENDIVEQIKILDSGREIAMDEGMGVNTRINQ